MSASLLRNGIKRSQYSIHNLYHRHSISDPIGAPILRNLHQHQPKAYARFPHSIYRKTKELDFSVPKTSSSSNIGFVGWYLGMINRRPILTKSITSALIYTAADFSSQTITQPSSEPYDLVRTLRMAGYGLLIVGPSLHFWFNFVSKALPKCDLITTLKKIVMGQITYGPIMSVVFFSLNAGLQGFCDPERYQVFQNDESQIVTAVSHASVIRSARLIFAMDNAMVALFSGENGAEILARLKRDLLPTMISAVMYWPFCDFVTFKFIPVHLQPLVSNSFSYLWTVYITYMASLEKAGIK